MINEFVNSLDSDVFFVVMIGIQFGFLYLVGHLDDKYLGWMKKISDVSKLLGIIVMLCVLYFPYLVLSLLMKF